MATKSLDAVLVRLVSSGGVATTTINLTETSWEWQAVFDSHPVKNLLRIRDEI